MQVLTDPVPVPEEGVLSAELQSFVLQCMRKDPFTRPTAEGLLSHNFILKVGLKTGPCMCTTLTTAGDALRMRRQSAQWPP